MKNNRRSDRASKAFNKRKAIKNKIMDKSISMEERFAAVMKLSAMSPNESKVRVRNRCELSGRPRGYYRKLRMSRIALRDLASMGMIPGMTKSSW